MTGVSAPISVDSSGYPNAVLGPNGRPIGVSSRSIAQHQTKKWRAAFANVRAGAANAKIAFAGDSTLLGAWAEGVIWAGNRPFCFADLVANRLTAMGINSQKGSIFGDGNMSAANLDLYDTRVVSGTWSAASITGIPGGRTISSTTASVAPFNFTPAGSIDTIETWTVTNAAYQDFEVAVDGGATISTVDASQAVSILKTTSACALGAHTVNIRKSAANAAQTHILGINCFDSTVKAVQCWNMGYASGTSALWGTTTSSVWLAPNLLATYAPDLTVICVGINDWIAAVSAATFKTNMQVLITKALISGSVILVTPPPTDLAYGGMSLANMEALINATFELASENNVPVCDLYSRLENYTSGNALGFYGDQIHMDKTGYHDAVDLLMEYI